MTRPEKIPLIDTNIILRYLIGDAPDKAARAVALMEQVEKGFKNIEIPAVIVAETIWTLEKFYNVPRKDIADKLLSILFFKGVKGAEKKTIIRALNSYIAMKIDFVDCYLAAKSVESKTPVYGFDKKDFKRLDADWKMP